MSRPPEPARSDFWQAFLLLGTLGAIVIAALVLFWMAALRMAEARHTAEQADSGSQEPITSEPVPTPKRVLPPPPKITVTAAPIATVAAAAIATATAAPSASSASSGGGASSDDASPMGTMNFNSLPSSTLTLDGQNLGATPILGRKVTPGVHLAVFASPLGRKSITFTAVAGETHTIATKFDTVVAAPSDPYP